MTLDPITTTTHTALILGVLKLYLQNRNNHRDNIEKTKMMSFKINQMWIQFCKEHGIDSGVNGSTNGNKENND